MCIRDSYRVSFVGLTLSFPIWVLADSSYPVLVVFASVLGVSYGGFISLSPAIMADRFGTVGLGGLLGALYTAAGIGGLVGPPLLGAIIDRSGHTAAQWTACGAGAVAVALLSGLTPKADV